MDAKLVSLLCSSVTFSDTKNVLDFFSFLPWIKDEKHFANEVQPCRNYEWHFLCSEKKYCKLLELDEEQ